MTRQIARDLRPVGDDDGFDLSKMTAKEVAAELVRRHQALQAKPTTGKPERASANPDVTPGTVTTDLSGAAQPAAVTWDAEIYPAPDQAPDGFWHLDRSLHVPPSMPMLAARDAFGAIAKLEAAAQHNHVTQATQHSAVKQPEMTADHGELVVPDRPVRYDPLDQPVESLMPAPRAIDDAGRRNGPVTVAPSISGNLPSETGKSKIGGGFGTGFAWGVVVGALLMVALLAAEIAIYPSLHLPARLHQLRTLITSGASSDGGANGANLATAPSAMSTAAGSQLPVETSSLVPSMNRPQPLLLSAMPSTMLPNAKLADPDSAIAHAAVVPAATATVPAAMMPPAAAPVAAAKPITVQADTAASASVAAKPKTMTSIAKAKPASQQPTKSAPARAKAIAALLNAQLSGAKR